MKSPSSLFKIEWTFFMLKKIHRLFHIPCNVLLQEMHDVNRGKPGECKGIVKCAVRARRRKR